MAENPWLFEDLPMETSLPSLWGYHESVEELKHKLWCTTMELETVRNNAKEEMRKSEENINNLILLLKMTSQERDEARDQLQILLNKMAQASPVNACFQAETQQMVQIRGNSSVTDSDTLSETPKHHHQQQQQHQPQSADSFFDAVSSSPDVSGNVGGSQQVLVECKQDQASAIIDGLVSAKNLPENGKFLQAVMEAGPLLQTLLVAGPLPRWRNPPPLQPFQIPPVSVKCCNGPQVPNSTPAFNHPNYSLHCSSASMLSFKRSSLPSCGISYQNLSAKRQKSQ
ncbi:K Homology domain type 1 domain-containing protein [Dioscorea alata]|uniref:K Homology domain type 1 domain-containing protein n=1 Tax=Dioscorea alata TaxID=55571 RepID=A0ACB7VUD9_DIOAL|nr:K Homology domain type 1 domain-containing protein [Dioscorea alata]